MPANTPGRNDPCPCGSGRRFKQCCLQARGADDSARLRLRGAEGRVVDTLLDFTAKTWGEPLIAHGWEDFWVYEDVPDDMPSTPEFDTMFIPWLVLGFVPDPEADSARQNWPTQPIGLEWLACRDGDISTLESAYIETACRSPLSVFAVEHVTPQQSVAPKDVLTGRRFHALEQGASQRLQPGDLLFTRVLTLDDASIMFGASPFIVPPRWHTHVIDWREQMFRKRLMSRQDLEEFDIEIREMYFQIAAELLNPTPPKLSNTDGDPLLLTTLTYELTSTVEGAVEGLAPLARVHGDDHIDEITRDGTGAIVTAVLSWVKAGNRQNKDWDNTVLGTLRLSAGRLVADVNSARRAGRLKREIAKRMGSTATLIGTDVVDPSEVLTERLHRRAPDARNDEPARETPPELRAMEKDLRRRHWEQWLETRVPALGNKTPRQAARSAGGRERLEALLAQFERAEAAGHDASADVEFIRTELGLTKRV